MFQEMWLFIVVGFFAQLIDGSLGMGYGVISASSLLAAGVPPSHSSAAVHLSKLFTTATAGASHIFHQNVDWPLFKRLSIAGVIGGCIGAYILTSVNGAALRPVVVFYLFLMGILILVKAWRCRTLPDKPLLGKHVLPLGGIGGFLDAIGGGGWGPVVTSSLIGAGAEPRLVIGSVNAAEFVVTLAVSLSFVLALITGHWTDSDGIMDHATAVSGLIIGGLIAAPLAGWLLKILPVDRLKVAVGCLIILLSLFQAYKMLA